VGPPLPALDSLELLSPFKLGEGHNLADSSTLPVLVLKICHLVLNEAPATTATSSGVDLAKMLFQSSQIAERIGDATRLSELCATHNCSALVQ